MHNILIPIMLLLFSGLQTPSFFASEEANDESMPVLERASQLLNSNEAADRAWGAYLAGQNKLTVLQSKLEELLRKSESYEFQLDEVLVRRCIVDAAINMGAALPEEIINNRYTNDAIVLFAQSPKNYANAILSRFTKETNTARWLALGNLLLEIKERRFPLVLIKEMKVVPVTVYVHDPDYVGPGEGGRGGPGFNSVRIPEGFPPLGIYNFTNAAVPGAVHAFAGPRTVYVTRRMINPGYILSSSSDSAFWPDDSSFFWGPRSWNPPRLEFLSSFLNLPKEDIYFHIDVSWSNKKQYVEAVRSYCSRILQKLDHILALLQDQNLISGSEANRIRVSITLSVSDDRSHKSVVLPAIHMDRVLLQ
jgi:hypothetical protein